jgi:asparagine synthase (glutamine-hydrolysing)
LRIGKEFLSDFSNIAAKSIYVTDGCRDVCGSHNIYLNRLARRIAPIRITGTFGGEILRSVTGFKAVFPDEKLFHPDFKKHLLNAGNTVNNIKKGHKLSFLLFKEAPWRINNIIIPEQSQLTYRTPYMDNGFLSLIYQAPADVLTTKDISLRLIKDNNQDLFNIMSDRGFGGRNNFLFSKCVQLFYRFVFKAEWFYNTGMPHWMAKLDYMLAPLHLGSLILGRNKYAYYRIWFQNEISDYVREILLDKRTADRPFLNEKFLEEMVNGHINGNRNYLYEINKTLTIELIHRLLIENI